MGCKMSWLEKFRSYHVSKEAEEEPVPTMDDHFDKYTLNDSEIYMPRISDRRMFNDSLDCIGESDPNKAIRALLGHDCNSVYLQDEDADSIFSDYSI